jgi:hypothetical protein
MIIFRNALKTMKLLKIIAITLIALTGVKGMACEKHPRRHQQPSSDSTTEQLKK